MWKCIRCNAQAACSITFDALPEMFIDNQSELPEKEKRKVVIRCPFSIQKINLKTEDANLSSMVMPLLQNIGLQLFIKHYRVFYCPCVSDFCSLVDNRGMDN